MVGKRKALAYSKRKVTPYTRRSKKKSKNYIKTVPPQKIVKFFMGNIQKFESGGFQYRLRILAGRDILIRDLALEASRQLIHKELEKKLQSDYFLACKTYPHHILRNNKVFSGSSKGERVQSGMKHSFGKSEGRAAQVKKGKEIFIMAFNNKENLNFIKDVIRKTLPKFPCKTKVVFEDTALIKK